MQNGLDSSYGGKVSQQAKYIRPFDKFSVPSLGLDIVQHPEVASPQFDDSGIWTLERLPSMAKMSVLDMGTGTGLIGITAAVKQDASRVLMTDVMAPAVTCAQATVNIHDATDRVEVIQSDLFDQVPSGYTDFDAIIFNIPPADQKPDPKRGLTYAYCDPGRKTLKRFLDTVPTFLRYPDQRVFIAFAFEPGSDIKTVSAMILAAKGLTYESCTFESRGDNIEQLKNRYPTQSILLHGGMEKTNGHLQTRIFYVLRKA